MLSAPDSEPSAVRGVNADNSLSGDELVAMYRMMVLARAVDQKAWNLQRIGKIPFVIPGQGQEAAQVGSAWALRKG